MADNDYGFDMIFSYDADSDGTTDLVDRCSQDPAKSIPGTCGCGVSDVDANGNGIADCNDPVVDPITPGSTFKGLVEEARALLKSLKVNKKKTKDLRAQIASVRDQLVDIATSSADSISVTSSSTNLLSLTTKAKKKITRALKARKLSFKKRKAAARKQLKKILGILS